MNAISPIINVVGWLAVGLSQLGALYTLLAALATLGKGPAGFGLPMLMTFASLCCRASVAVSSFQASAARMPLTLLAAIASPLPEPPMTMPRLSRSAAVAIAAAMMYGG